VLQLAQHHAVSVAKAQVATEFWKQQAEQGQSIVEEVNKGIASMLAEQRQAAQQDLQDSLKSRAQQLSQRYYKDLTDELKEQYSKHAKVCLCLYVCACVLATLHLTVFTSSGDVGLRCCFLVLSCNC
jgi:hypothetical protein